MENMKSVNPGVTNQYRPCFVPVSPTEVVRYPVPCVMDTESVDIV